MSEVVKKVLLYYKYMVCEDKYESALGGVTSVVRSAEFC